MKVRERGDDGYCNNIPTKHFRSWKIYPCMEVSGVPGGEKILLYGE